MLYLQDIKEPIHQYEQKNNPDSSHSEVEKLLRVTTSQHTGLYRKTKQDIDAEHKISRLVKFPDKFFVELIWLW